MPTETTQTDRGKRKMKKTRRSKDIGTMSMAEHYMQLKHQKERTEHISEF